MKNLVFVLLLAVLSGCGPSMTAVWENPSYTYTPIKKLGVIAITSNLEARQSLENEIIANMTQKMPEVTYLRGLDLFPPGSDYEEWTQEKFEKVLMDNDLDMVLTTSMLHTYTSKDYVPGDAYPDYYGVGPYMYGTYATVYRPGYYEQVNHIVLESNFFDIREGVDSSKSLVWKGQSELIDPSNITNGAINYAANLVRYLDREYDLENLQ